MDHSWSLRKSFESKSVKSESVKLTENTFSILIMLLNGVLLFLMDFFGYNTLLMYAFKTQQDERVCAFMLCLTAGVDLCAS